MQYLWKSLPPGITQKAINGVESFHYSKHVYCSTFPEENSTRLWNGRQLMDCSIRSRNSIYSFLQVQKKEEGGQHRHSPQRLTAAPIPRTPHQFYSFSQSFARNQRRCCALGGGLFLPECGGLKGSHQMAVHEDTWRGWRRLTGPGIEDCTDRGSLGHGPPL